ncbi:YoaK family protein [Actinomycetospora termitidis]|uniref:YoaK family protein n=1 Tax=Actinomycetospora termitidis TaxID=3053470 RepID=A0ABT7MAM7_9PSEU|nr:YoaK family protein [Actinomycetospora sp. Odt1-22]MDL5157715.1 YoaK family protein [Actinomycetospora sp. Odt1-22]
MTGFDHPERRPRLLGTVTVVLTAAAGAIDVVTFFAFNQVFASTMTGNLVLLGLGLGQGEWEQVVDNVCAIVGYCSGLVVGTLICGLAMRRLPWRNAVGITLTTELALLVAVGLYWWGVDDGSELGQVRVIVLVIGSGLAMGVQAAAMRYIGPAGTPTSFLSGTVTNWVSSLVELHKPFTWNWNSPLRIGVIVVAAAGNAVIQARVPDVAFAVPVLLVLVAILGMAVVTRANHGGLVAGEPEFAPDPRSEVPDASDEAADPGPDDERIDGIGRVSGRVVDDAGTASPAAVTLVDMAGQQVRRVHTEPEGGSMCSPRRPATSC